MASSSRDPVSTSPFEAASGLGDATSDTERPPPASGHTSNTEPVPRSVETAHGSPVPPSPQMPAMTNLGLAPSLAPPTLASSARIAVAGLIPLVRRCTSCNERYPQDFVVCPRDATPLVDEALGATTDPLVGKLLGETYQIVRVVGEGGMGRVYEARHLRLKERRFAVKTLHGELARNPEMAARFLQEAESASSISHSNVVDVFDVHHLPDGTPYLVGEFLEGEELADYVMRRGPLEPRLAVDVARQVASALAAAHDREIIHRDMKPENVFVLERSIAALARGEDTTLLVKVLDFGISKAKSEGANLTRTGVILGTPSYMAPEQARGQQVDHRADVYSVGAVLYYMLTARRPFDADDPTSTISMVLTQDPKRPREIDARIPEGVELVVQHAMAKDPNDRYPTMRDLERALRSALGTRSAPPLALAPNGMEAPRDVGEKALALAKALLGSGSLPPPSTSTDIARVARPTIVIISVVLGLWLVGGAVAALTGLVRILHDGEVTLTEAILLVVGCLFAAATPIGLYVVQVRRGVWPNTLRALQLASDLKRTAVAALVAYGGLAIAVRISHTVILRSSRGLASGAWDIVLFVVSVTAAALAGGFGPFVRGRRTRASKP